MFSCIPYGSIMFLFVLMFILLMKNYAFDHTYVLLILIMEFCPNFFCIFYVIREGFPILKNILCFCEHMKLNMKTNFKP